MKDNEVIATHLSPCVRIFIDLLLKGELTTSVALDIAGRGISLEVKEDPDRPSDLKQKMPR